MRTRKITAFLLFCVVSHMTSAQSNDKPIYQSNAYSIFKDRVEQDTFKAMVISPKHITSSYRSPDADKYSPNVSFKFAINGIDNEMLSGSDHLVTLRPEKNRCTTAVVFGRQLVETFPLMEGESLAPNTLWTIRLDMREVMRSFQEKGFYTLFNGERLHQADFKGVWVAGVSAPLTWDFNKLTTRPELQLQDEDGDGIYEVGLLMNATPPEKKVLAAWKQVNDGAAFPRYESEYPISDALYNLAIDEMIRAVEPDSTFRTGKEWAGVWTRDISYSILLSMAQLQPEVARESLMRKVKNGRIIQDTGTGGAYPVSTDRIVWALAAWELYKVTGDRQWLAQSYAIIKNTVEDDLLNAYDLETGLVKGESSFLDWREQTYPRWMQPADIFLSESLGTNAVHYQANRILAQMALLLNDGPSNEKHTRIALGIKKGVNARLWLKNKGYYAQYTYGRDFKSLSPRAEALGEALTVLFDLAGKQRQQSVVARVPITDFGIPCIYPQIPGIPPYHNDAVWPFVQSFWAMASAKAGNETAVLESIAAVYRPAALFLTNKENFVSRTGDYAGTQINSDNMLWSLSGSIALIHKVLFGMDFQTRQLSFHPFVPKALAGKRSLKGFKYRRALLDIEMEGFGNKIRSFELDGKPVGGASIPCTLTGRHTLRIVLANNDLSGSPINKVANYTAPDTPVAAYSNGSLSWKAIEGAKYYEIQVNGKKVRKVTDLSVRVPASAYAEYLVVAVDQNHVPSFASEPVIVARSKEMKTYEAESFAPASDQPCTDFRGNGFIEISQTVNRRVVAPVEVDRAGTYAISFRYSNGNGPVNTDNKCAMRTLTVDGKIAGILVFPQRGANEWSNWGYTNAVQVKLSKGHHQVTLSFEPSNENMNGEINQAMLDVLKIVRVK